MTTFRCHDADACAFGQKPCPTPRACGCEAPAAGPVELLKEIDAHLRAEWAAGRLPAECWPRDLADRVATAIRSAETKYYGLNGPCNRA